MTSTYDPIDAEIIAAEEAPFHGFPREPKAGEAEVERELGSQLAEAYFNARQRDYNPVENEWDETWTAESEAREAGEEIEI